MEKDTLLNFLKTLPIEKQSAKEHSIVYSGRAWKLGMVEIKPAPSQKELDEALEWMEQNGVGLPVCRNSAVIDKLIKIA